MQEFGILIFCGGILIFFYKIIFSALLVTTQRLSALFLFVNVVPVVSAQKFSA